MRVHSYESESSNSREPYWFIKVVLVQKSINFSEFYLHCIYYDRFWRLNWRIMYLESKTLTRFSSRNKKQSRTEKQNHQSSGRLCGRQSFLQKQLFHPLQLPNQCLVLWFQKLHTFVKLLVFQSAVFDPIFHGFYILLLAFAGILCGNFIADFPVLK